MEDRTAQNVLSTFIGSFLFSIVGIVVLKAGAYGDRGRVVLFRFPSEAQARAWYADPEYQALSEHRRAGTTLEFLTMIHGLPPRG